MSASVIALFGRTPRITPPEDLAVVQVRARLRQRVTGTRLAQAEARAYRSACAGVQAQVAADRAVKWALGAYPTQGDAA